MNSAAKSWLVALDPGASRDTGGSVAMAVYAADQMRLSIMTSSDNSVDFIRILGDVDLSDSRQLGHAARRLVDTEATTIYVDLGGTTFIGSTLVAFLVQIATTGGKGRPLILCRPSPTARRVIQMTGLEELATIRADLPASWPAEAGGSDAANEGSSSS